MGQNVVFYMWINDQIISIHGSLNDIICKYGII